MKKWWKGHPKLLVAMLALLALMTIAAVGSYDISVYPVRGDHTWSGTTGTFTAGTNLTFGQVVYMASADGKMELTDANAAATMPVVAMALAAISENATGLFLLDGAVRDDTWNWAALGGALYTDNTTAGAMVQVAPGGSGDQVQKVGWAVNADNIIFHVDPTIVEVP